MYSRLRIFAGIAFLCMAPVAMHAQFKIGQRSVQIHGFASQGFAYSGDNNFLSMKTTQGSFALTDGGANISTQLTDKFRVGAQLYLRNVGQLGNWHPQLDWAFGDYRVRDWLGFRGGKVKTALGLYNDTQDMSFLHTWALLPQSVYPTDVRGDTIAHIGGDVYGNIALKKLGNVSYTAYGGKRPSDSNGGYVYALTSSTKIGPDFVPISTRRIDAVSGPVYGADLRWNTPIKGLMTGASYISQDVTTDGIYLANDRPYRSFTDKDRTNAFYLEYTLGNFRFDGEYRRQIRFTHSLSAVGVLSAPSGKDARMGYVSAAYRIFKPLEVGAYHSRYYDNWPVTHGLLGNYVFDQVVTARMDLRSYLDLKVEGHFIDGYVQGIINRGFYIAMNRNGLQPTTRLLVIRLGFHM